MSASDSALYAAADAASPITEGMCLTKANLYTYRNRDADQQLLARRILASRNAIVLIPRAAQSRSPLSRGDRG